MNVYKTTKTQRLCMLPYAMRKYWTVSGSSASSLRAANITGSITKSLLKPPLGAAGLAGPAMIVEYISLDKIRW